MISDFFVPELDDIGVDDLWFQQNGAKRNTTNETKKFVDENYWWEHYIASCGCGVAFKIMGFNTGGLFLVDLCEVACLRRWAWVDRRLGALLAT